MAIIQNIVSVQISSPKHILQCDNGFVRQRKVRKGYVGKKKKSGSCCGRQKSTTVLQKSRRTPQNTIFLNSGLEKTSKTTEQSSISYIAVSYTNQMQNLCSCRNLAKEFIVSVIFYFLFYILLFCVCGFSEFQSFFHFTNEAEPHAAQL